MIQAKISEIFQSIQGEGKYAGVRQVFVRFFGCHMHCTWCDTPDSIGDGKIVFKEYSAAALYREVKPLAKDCHSISLTGGEPLLQADFIKEFISYIKTCHCEEQRDEAIHISSRKIASAGKRPRNDTKQKPRLKIYLETSGVLHKELAKVINDVDIVSMDFKLPSSTKCRPFWKEHEQFLKIAKKKDVFIKAVITSSTEKKDVKRTAEIISTIDPDMFFVLQPNWFDRQNGVMEKCLAFQEFCLQYLPNARVMPQMHKYLKLR